LHHLASYASFHNAMAYDSAQLFKEGSEHVAELVEHIICDTYWVMKEWNHVVFKFEKWPPWFPASRP
jgi:hypothetical protein